MRAQARPTAESSKPAAAAGESQTVSAAHRVRSASPGPKPVPVPVPSSLPNRTPGRERNRRGSTAIRVSARGSAAREVRHTCSVTSPGVVHATSAGLPAVTRSSSV